MVTLKKVDGNNIWDILKLRVNDYQKEFVASNDVSIIEAYIADKYNGVAYPFGIYDDDLLVGFPMIGFDKDDYWTDASSIATGKKKLYDLLIKEIQIYEVPQNDGRQIKSIIFNFPVMYGKDEVDYIA